MDHEIKAVIVALVCIAAVLFSSVAAAAYETYLKTKIELACGKSK